MRILVISDSHRRTDVVEKILDAQPTATEVFFLGDNTRDIEDLQYIYPEKKFHIVSGNGDFCSQYPTTATAVVAGKKVFFTHGHTLLVQSGTGHLLASAKQNECDVALYGHTHISKILYEDGVYIVNPGSCSCARDFHESYAVIDIEENGIMPIIINL